MADTLGPEPLALIAREGVPRVNGIRQKIASTGITKKKNGHFPLHLLRRFRRYLLTFSVALCGLIENASIYVAE